MLPLKGFDQLLVAGVDVDPARRPAFVQRRGDTDEFTNGSFAGVPDPNERDYLNQLPTSFVLPDEAVDRLRAAAGAALLNSPDFQQLLSDVHARIVEEPTTPHFQNAPEHQEKSPVNIYPGS